MFFRSRFLSFPLVIGAVVLELFQGRQYLDPNLMITGKRSLWKRHLQKGTDTSST
ncbi:hypothetical protein Peur_023112 [Populus x canadensis]